MNKIVKVFLILVGALVGLALLFVGWVAVQFNVIYPWKYARFEAEAGEWNADQWQNGTALRVTVQVQADAQAGGATATADMLCFYRKIAGKGGLKGPPAIGTQVLGVGPDHLVVGFGPDATHETPLRSLCSDAMRNADSWRLPQVSENPSYWSYIVARDGAFQCFLSKGSRTSTGTVTRPTYTQVTRVPLRAQMALADYLAVERRTFGDQANPAPRYSYWDSNGVACWRGMKSTDCAPEVLAVCGRPLG